LLTRLLAGLLRAGLLRAGLLRPGLLRAGGLSQQHSARQRPFQEISALHEKTSQ
jgi:hypothetical protein